MGEKYPDINGHPIKEGSVLQKVSSPRDRGVVVKIYKVGEIVHTIPTIYAGDLCIRCKNSSIISNKYSSWKHIPHKEQSYTERFTSWAVNIGNNNKQENYDLLMSGILNLFPNDLVGDYYDDFPDTPETILRYLARYMDELGNKK